MKLRVAPAYLKKQHHIDVSYFTLLRRIKDGRLRAARLSPRNFQVSPANLDAFVARVYEGR